MIRSGSFSQLGRGFLLALVATAAGGCALDSRKSPTPSEVLPALLDTGISGPWDRGGPVGLEWQDDRTLTVVRFGDSNRQHAVFIDLETLKAEPIRADVPSGCASVDIQNPRRMNGRLFVDRRCFTSDGTDYHEILRVDPGGELVSMVSIPWFPDSYVELAQGGWLSGFDSGPCAWIDLVPKSGTPKIAWPIVVKDDGEPFAVNASPKDDCDNAVLASSLDRSPNGDFAFVASGAARSAQGLARLDVPQNLYVVSELGGDPRRIASGLVEARNVRWSPDGSAIIVITRMDDGSALMVIDTTGEQRVIYRGQPIVAVWDPAGSRIAIIVQNDLENRVLIVRVAKG